MKNLFLLFFLCFSCKISSAQKENNIWYFGTNAGIDFNSGTPVALTNGALNTSEGCATVSDSAGNLLFYTDGISIWNKNHTLMPNGTGLAGNNTATQSALIVKKPGSTNLYYVISTHFTLAYSIVDMTLNGGLGDVSLKNDTLTTKGSEKLCGAAHVNGTDYWIISHERASDAFNVFCVSAAGISKTPVHSNAGIVTSGGPGQMKISPNATKIAFGQPKSSDTTTTCIVDFNCATGVVSGGWTIPSSYSQVYGLEFSPNSRFLYTGAVGTNDIYQYDLNLGLPSAIITAAIIIGNPGRQVTSMQLGPDMKKLYVCLTNYGYIDAINDPDSLGLACNFTHNAVNLGGKTAKLGLPNFITSFYNCARAGGANFISSDTTFCEEGGKCIDFFDRTSCGTPVSWNWSFPGASPDTSTAQNPTGICYNVPGTYPVTLIISTGVDTDTLTVPQLIVFSSGATLPVVTFSGDTVFSTPASSYQWFKDGLPIAGATNSFYVATEPGNYSVQITDENGCSRLSNSVLTNSKEIGNDRFIIYPNPVKDQLVISGIDLAGNSRIEIYNAIGEKVYSDSFHNKIQTIDSKLFSAGIYFVKIFSSEELFIQKFIKE